MLGQLAGGVGHELRNPLAALQTSMYFLKLTMGENSDAKVRKHLGIMEQELNNANEIITNLLDFSRLRQADRVKVPVSELLRAALDRYDFGAVEVEKHVEDAGVLADSGQIRQVLTNLLTNAIQAMPEGGRLTISSGRFDGEAWIAVADTGTGIDAATLEKIFQPLFTTKAKGIGLGLAVCESLVRANGGRISVKSEPGKGSTFTIHLQTSEA